MFEDISLYFSDGKMLEKLRAKGQYYRTVKKARGQIESRKYWVSKNVKWLTVWYPQREKLRGIGLTCNTIEHDEVRYFFFISSAEQKSLIVVCEGVGKQTIK